MNGRVDDGSSPTFLSLFSGIGGFDFALERTGWRCAQQIELDPFCARVLAARFPRAPRWPDVRQWQGDGHEPPDLLVGGFPCQDFSVAGKRAGLVGYRGTLFWEIVRIAKEIKPAWGLFENVPGLLSSHRGRDFWAVLQGLRECWPAVGWRILDSRYFGVPQRRRRVFLVCGPSEESVASVLFEPEGGGGHPAAGGEARAEVADPLGGGAYGSGRRDEDDPNLIVARQTGRGYWNDDGFAGLRSHPGGIAENIVAALRRVCDCCGERKSTIGQCGYCLDCCRRHHQSNQGIVGPLRTNPYNNSDPTMEVQQLVAHALSAEGADASEDGTGRGMPLIWPIQEVGKRENKKQHGEGMGLSDSDVMYTLQAGAEHGIASSAAVRRLTSLEGERLQNFPDGFTCLCQPLEAYTADPEEAAWSCKCPDGPRYRALGNAVTVSVVEWISHRLKAAWDAGR